MNFETFSQAGQDLFAQKILLQDPTFIGWYLDIGANHPTERNNTWAFEKRGWRGWLVDHDATACQMCRDQRPRSTVLQGDCTKMDWSNHHGFVADYLSLDVDSASLATLKGVLAADIRFRVATIEHDAYAYPEGTKDPRDEMRALLRGKGYDLLCPDVCDCSDWNDPSSRRLCFEDWWVYPGAVDMTFANRFRNDGMMLGKEIAAR